MAGYEIGISGLQTAQKALEVIGNNIANAATEGYHRQAIDLRPADEVYSGGLMIGQGVEFSGVRRMVNQVLEDEMLRRTSSGADLEKRMETLRIIENAFGELSSNGPSVAIEKFFASFNDLSLHPNDVNFQSAVLSSAATLANQFRNLGTLISNVEEMLYNEAVSTAERVNILAAQIADMNKEIYDQRMRGGNINNTIDQRDQLITELGTLVGVRTVARDTGMVDITVSDTSLVVGSTAIELEVGLTATEDRYQIGFRLKGTEQYDSDLSGGVLGGLFKLKNELVSGIHAQFDMLARTIISETNRLHVQGVGASGSFTMLSGWTMSETAVADMDPPVTDGKIRIRVIDPAGQVQRHTITVDSASTLASVASDIAAIPGLDMNSDVNAGRLQIIANTGYSFDFLAGALSLPNSTVPDPLAGVGAGATELPPAISISGGYIGDTDETYTCTVNTTPPGQTHAIGTGSMELEIQNASGDVIKTVNIGEGYVAGEELVLDNGIKVCFQSNGVSPGFFNDGEQFVVEALANSDSSGFLMAVGINSFFSGTDAGSISVSASVKENGAAVAVSRTVEMTDNLNATAIAALGDSVQGALGQLTVKQFYRKLVVDLGDELSVTEMQHSNTLGIQRSLEQQRDEISGVDVNEQASLMMVYERMFQAMARYMNTINKTYETVLTIIR